MNANFAKRILYAALVGLVGVFTSACAGPVVGIYHVTEGHAMLRADYSSLEAPTAPKEAATIELTVTSSASVGCIIGDACIDLKATERPAEKDEFEAELKRRQRAGIVVHDVGPAIAAILQERLAQRFQSAAVRFARGAEATKARVAAKIDRTSRPARVQLTATIDGEAPFSVTGESEHWMSGGHWGWALPVAVATFPVSLLWMPPVFGSLQQKHGAIAVADAIDKAATSLAEQLAARSRVAAGRPLRVAVVASLH